MTGWMSPLKREQATRERESGLRDVNSLQTLLWRSREKVGHELSAVYLLQFSMLSIDHAKNIRMQV